LTVITICIVGMVVIGVLTDPGSRVGPVNRLFFWTFVAFSVGLVELFVLFISLAITGRIDLPKVFQDKEAPGALDSESVTKSVSLARLQAFLWTLVVMCIYFHQAVVNGKDELPPVPPTLLMVMGISSAVYLTSKQMGSSNKQAPATDSPAANEAARAAGAG
jgi:hypothetical protein